MAKHHKKSQFPLNSHFVPQMWLNVPSPTYGGYSYQQCIDQANYNLLTNSILMQQRENEQLRTKLQIVEKKLRLEMSLKIQEMPICGTECAKNLQEKNEKISILEEELTKMIVRFGRLVKKDSELLLENVKCIHEPEEIANLKQKLSEISINIENERGVNSVNAKRLLEKEEEISSLEAELAEMKYKIEKESELKKENTIRLQEKEEEIANLDQQLSEIVNNIEKEREVNREENTDRLHEQEEEIAKLKQELSKLSANVQELNRQVQERNAKLNAFKVINDMLVSSIESRDETIIQYKKKLQKNTKDTSSSDVDSLLGNISPLQTSSPVLNAVENIEKSDYNPLPETLSTPEESNSRTMSVALRPSNTLQNNKGKSSTSQLDPRPKDRVKELKAPSMSNSLMPWNGAHKWRFAKRALFDITTPEAGNTTEFWICLHCDENQKFVTYPEYRQHLIEIHNEVLDPALCAKCGWLSSNGLDLDFHMYKQHQIPSLFYSFSVNEFSTSLLAK